MGVPHLDLTNNVGLAGVTRMGFMYAWENGYDCAMVVDGDGQHPPKYIKLLIDKIEEGYDYVIGSRFVNKPKDRFFLYVGRIQPTKGLMPLLEAYNIFCKTCPVMVPLHVIGGITDEHFHQQVLHFIEENKLSNSVFFEGQISDVSHWMQKALAIIIPSLSEGFGFCMPEAMFNGCLAIGYNVGGTKEQMDNGLELQGKEIALRYDNITELVEHLKNVASTAPEEYNPYILRAFDTVNLLYSMEHHADQVYLFYQDILNNTLSAHGKFANKKNKNHFTNGH
jgi:glycosyltransferase involved in cell wall biosynthesis